MSVSPRFRIITGCHNRETAVLKCAYFSALPFQSVLDRQFASLRVWTRLTWQGRGKNRPGRNMAGRVDRTGVVAVSVVSVVFSVVVSVVVSGLGG